VDMHYCLAMAVHSAAVAVRHCRSVRVGPQPLASCTQVGCAEKHHRPQQHHQETLCQQNWGVRHWHLLLMPHNMECAEKHPFLQRPMVQCFCCQQLGCVAMHPLTFASAWCSSWCYQAFDLCTHPSLVQDHYQRCPLVVRSPSCLGCMVCTRMHIPEPSSSKMLILPMGSLLGHDQ